jgi:hypothetical protein
MGMLVYVFMLDTLHMWVALYTYFCWKSLSMCMIVAIVSMILVYT